MSIGFAEFLGEFAHESCSSASAADFPNFEITWVSGSPPRSKDHPFQKIVIRNGAHFIAAVCC